MSEERDAAMYRRGYFDAAHEAVARQAFAHVTIAYVVVGYFGYEGLTLEAVSLNRTVAEAKRDELNLAIGDDDEDPTLNRYRVYEQTLLETM